MTALVVLLCVLAFFVALFLFLALPGRVSGERFAPFYGLYHAHRGLHSPDRTVPENSLAAFEAAVRAGYGIELDIQLSRDGQVVVFHDDELERVCGVPGRVDAYSYDELRALRLEGTDEVIPLFSQVLALVGGRAPLIVELKMGPQNAKLCAAAKALLEGYDGPYCVESFDPRIVHWFHKNAPDIVRGQLAAPPAVLENGAAGKLIGWGLSNFLGRPQFIAYQAVARPWPVRFAGLFARRVGWTLTPQHDANAFEAKNDALIFEYFTPPPHYK